MGKLDCFRRSGRIGLSRIKTPHAHVVKYPQAALLRVALKIGSKCLYWVNSLSSFEVDDELEFRCLHHRQMRLVFRLLECGPHKSRPSDSRQERLRHKQSAHHVHQLFGIKNCRIAGMANPITGIAGCCATAASGHAAAEPPSSVMNSRRFMCSPKPRITPYHTAEKPCCALQQFWPADFRNGSFSIEPPAASPPRG